MKGFLKGKSVCCSVQPFFLRKQTLVGFLFRIEKALRVFFRENEGESEVGFHFQIGKITKRFLRENEGQNEGPRDFSRGGARVFWKPKLWLGSISR